MKKEKNKKPMLVLLGFYALFLGVSYLMKFNAGMVVGENFGFFASEMLVLFPPAFVLVGLFMVWMDRKTIEQYFGEASGAMGYAAAVLMACTTLYPFIIVLPMAAALNKKGARLSIVLTYLGASSICRIPMSIFEASFLGIKFTVIRYVVSLPLIIVTSIVMEKIIGKDYFRKNNLYESIEA